MCFRVVFDKTVLGRIPPFRNVNPESLPRGDISAFTFPELPLLASDNPGKAFTAHWGLIPSWVKDEKTAKKIRSGTVNARSETVHEKPSFRNGWPGRRCILPVTGFFEPHLSDSGKETWKIFREDGSFFFLGGMYENTSSRLPAFPRRTFTLLTMEATGLLAEVHNGKKRMPLLMTPEKGLLWLMKNEDEPGLFESFWQVDQKELKGEKVN